MPAIISNPPYNLKINPGQYKWAVDKELLAVNANFAFVQVGLEISDSLACYLLPNGVLATTNSKELSVKKDLIDTGCIQAVVLLPPRMFESTAIPICLIVFTKTPTDKILMINLSEKGTKEIREQKGQFGGAAHTNRVYKKTINVIDDDLINVVSNAILTQTPCEGFSVLVSKEDVKSNGYDLSPAKYIPVEEQLKSRPLEDIIHDLNLYKRHQNKLKLVINGTLAQKLGLGEVIDKYEKSKVIDKAISTNIKSITGLDVIKDDYLQITKNKNQFEFKNNDPELFSEILQSVYQSWVSHIMFCNNIQNHYLEELRDALLPKLMSGEIDVSNISTENDR